MTNFNQKIGFGGASLSSAGGGYGFGILDKPQELLEYAFDHGITLYDTAPIYGFNQSELTLGEAFKSKRDKVQLLSKAGVTWHDNKRVDMSNDPKVITKQLHQSLKNLQSEYIDIYMIHWPDKRIDIRYPLEVLIKAKEQEKIIDIGLCNTNRQDLESAFELCEIKYLQSECNLFYNGFSGFETMIANHKIKKIGWGSLDKGILAGSVKLDRVFPTEDCRSWAPWWKKSNWKDKVKKVDLIENELRESIIKLAVQYTREEMDISLFGFKSIDNINEITSIFDIDLDPALLNEALKIARF